jgi:two-component system chemotaxis sensor kinase CheA
MALHLSTVARLEQFPAHLLEPGSEGPVVQYRGELLPVVTLADLTGERGGEFGGGRDGDGGGPDGSEKLQVVVYRQGARSVGVHVHRILDVVQQRVELKSAGTRPGMLGLAVIQDKATEMLDLQRLLGWNADLGEPGHSDGARS